MSSSQIYHLLLLALLPIIGLVVYIEGQSYDPALIQFASSEISTGSEAALFPRDIEGFNRSGPVRLFSKENLYEYVNGHAEYFLSAGFEQLAVGEYIQTGTEPDQPDLVVDIYDMGKAIQAFGVLSDEAGDDPSYLKAGMMGAKTPQGISFVSDKYYVKISSYRDTVPVDLFAVRIHRAIGSSSDALSAFSLFPDFDTVVATRFVKEAYRGIDFAKNVLEREYRIQDSTVHVSLITADDVEIKKLISSYFGFFQDSGTEVTKLKKDGLELYKVLDPYEGDWYLIPFSKALFGIYGADEERILDTFLVSLRRTDTEEK
jgi:hypothetical protein